MDTTEAHDLLERLGNLLRAEARAVGSEYSLQPVQLEALSFLTRCNRYSDTPQAVTEFLGLTKGTVSQSLKVLEQKGLLRKRGDKKDKRLVHLKPTAKGLRLIECSVPASVLVKGFETLSQAKGSLIVDALRQLLRTVQQANGLKTFAPCHSCRFNQQQSNGFICGLTQEPLAEQDTLLLCREHEYPLTEK